MQHIAQNGLQPQDIGVAPGAAGGLKGLILRPLDRFIFGDWLAQSSHTMHLVGLKWRHKATPFLSNMLLLAPNPDWVKTLPNAKLPDRGDFARYGADLQARVKAWSAAASASEQLADEYQEWLRKPDMGFVKPL